MEFPSKCLVIQGACIEHRRRAHVNTVVEIEGELKEKIEIVILVK